jgi:hypothetical protein
MSPTVALLVLLTSIGLYLTMLILMIIGVVTVYEDGSILVDLAGHQWGAAIPFTVAAQQ